MNHNVAIGIALIVGLATGFFARSVIAPGWAELWPVPLPEEVACTMDAFQCPDGSFVGRTGSSCEFVCPPTPGVAPEVLATIAAMSDRIIVTSPAPGANVASPLQVSGEARGNWFFEGSFPVVLTNWDGLIIAEGVATASGDWMTESFVPFTTTLTFTNPLTSGSPEYMVKGTLILKRDNPSGLPEQDAALELPIRFLPGPTTQSD